MPTIKWCKEQAKAEAVKSGLDIVVYRDKYSEDGPNEYGYMPEVAMVAGVMSWIKWEDAVCVASPEGVIRKV